jgi:hypothetical protein
MATLDSVLHEGPVTSRVSGRNVIIEQEIHYRVIAASTTENRVSILQGTAGLPVARVDNSGGLICRNVTLTPVPEHRLHYIAVARFSSEVTDSNDPATPQTGDPVDWVPQAELEFEPYEEVKTQDLSSPPKLWLNTAGRPYEQGFVVVRRIPTRVFVQFEPVGPDATPWLPSTAYAKHRYVTHDSGKVYQCTTAGTTDAITGPTGTGSSITNGTSVWKYVAVPAGAVTLDQIEERCDTINETVFRGRAINTLLLEVRRATIGTYFGFRRWKIEYAMKYKKDGWKRRQLNMGWEFKNGSGQLQKFQDPVDKSYYMGKLDASGDAVANQVTGSPHISEFLEYEEAEFNDFIRVA